MPDTLQRAGLSHRQAPPDEAPGGSVGPLQAFEAAPHLCNPRFPEARTELGMLWPSYFWPPLRVNGTKVPFPLRLLGG
jgi:hypothetical protein